MLETLGTFEIMSIIYSMALKNIYCKNNYNVEELKEFIFQLLKYF
jgi:hypothetical protein